MPARDYAKVVIADGGPSFEAFRVALESRADPGVDVDLLQVGVHEALVPPHLVRHLVARAQQDYRSVLVDAGANDVVLVSDAEAWALANLRIEDDLQGRARPSAPSRTWHLDMVGVEQAWQPLGGPGAIDWQGVRIGHIDTGYTHHVALGFGGGATTWIDVPDCRTIMDEQVPQDFYPFPQSGLDTRGVDPMPSGALAKGHGTRTGSTISGCCPLPDGSMYYGVAPQVPHVVVRITDSVAINTRQDEFIRALAYLVQQRVDVVNVSLGAFPPVASPQMRAALRDARDAGVIVSCAAGNYVAPVVVPAKLEGAIAVAGVTWKAQPWANSSHGPEVAFSAPAQDIFRPAPVAGGVGSAFAAGGDGTSYAAAITTGAAALWLRSWQTQIAARYGRTRQRVEAFRQAAMATSRQPVNWQPQPFGAGILHIGDLCTDASRALP